MRDLGLTVLALLALDCGIVGLLYVAIRKGDRLRAATADDAMWDRGIGHYTNRIRHHEINPNRRAVRTPPTAEALGLIAGGASGRSVSASLADQHTTRIPLSAIRCGNQYRRPLGAVHETRVLVENHEDFPALENDAVMADVYAGHLRPEFVRPYATVIPSRETFTGAAAVLSRAASCAPGFTVTLADLLLLADIADGFSTVLHYDRLDLLRKRMRAAYEAALLPTTESNPRRCHEIDEADDAQFLAFLRGRNAERVFVSADNRRHTVVVRWTDPASGRIDVSAYPETAS